MRGQKGKEGKMNTLIKLTLSFRINLSNKVFEEILELLKKLMSIFLIDIKEEQDELQEIYRIEILNTTKEFKIKEYLDNDELNESKLQTLYQKEENSNSYIKEFIEIYGLEKFLKIFTSNQEKENFYNELNLYRNEKALFSYLAKRFLFLKKDFINERIKNNFLILFDENIHVEETPSRINLNDYLEEKNLNKEEKQLLLLFIKDGELLSEKEVGELLGISQQAVSKRIKKIIEKNS